MLTLSLLSDKKRTLLSQSLADFDARWDESADLLRSWENGAPRHPTRASAFYALALLLRQSPGDPERADRIIRKVLSLQFLSPGQIWHGTFASSLEQPTPVRSGFDISQLTPRARWQVDVFQEQLNDALQARLRASSALSGFRKEITRLLSASVLDVFPVVWQTYDPNWREFIFATFALILEEFESLLPADTVSAMEHAAKEGLAGARFRAESGLTPMNTNVEVMHVFIFDAFARRFRDDALAKYAADYATAFTEEYKKLHAVAEFNSPTYNGVVLSYTGLLRNRGGSAAVREMGEVLEAGLWEDFADFYNPAMRELCGPYSRAYGMEIRQTALPMLMYLGLDAIPVEQGPQFCVETESACILCCADVKIPEKVQVRLTSASGERRIERPFRELAERGEPGQNHSLCTATAWITDRIMLGAIRGSTNTSHQLHSGTAHWRNPYGSISTFRLRRRTADGDLIHVRTVLFDLAADPGVISGTVRNETGAPVVCNFEIDSPNAANGNYQPGVWQVDGLRCRPAFTVETPDGQQREVEAGLEIQSRNLIWFNVPLQPGETLHLTLHFEL